MTKAKAKAKAKSEDDGEGEGEGRRANRGGREFFLAITIDGQRRVLISGSIHSPVALCKFLEPVQDAGFYAVLHIGPYVCAEWNYGGFPVRLQNVPGIELRTSNTIFMNEMQNFTSLIVDVATEENLFASQGGPVILARIENEHGNVVASHGDAGKAYVN
ncbi:Glycoside hydrolase 35, catalytic domain [Dillenia turbinata]|uniref:beta-galactosidase n=1 Tax=Dillenia turbinata TaxID=194707 RepID=A0AAN8ZS18_9MAGN